jgi:RNA-binding protein
MALRRLGTVVRTAQGLAIVRVPEPDGGAGGDDDPDPDHEIGTEALDDSLATVGRVVDVFGPVARPYLAVDPTGDPAALLGTTVYAR